MGFLVNSFLPFAGDPFFANVEALLHMDGADASTTFTDVTGRTWTASGNAQIDTAQSKFGGASGLFDGSGDYITTPTDANIHLGSSDFTIEFWLRPNSTSAGQGIYDQRVAIELTGFVITQPSANPTKIFFGAGDSDSASYNISYTSTGSVSVGNWYHIAITRSGSSWRLFINGALDGVSSGTFTVKNASNIHVGALVTGAAPYNGHIDELRVTVGTARYTASFTPPTKAFPDS